MRYKDNIQCAGAELLAAVREDALKINPASGGDFFALHIRRGDFQFKVSRINYLFLRNFCYFARM